MEDTGDDGLKTQVEEDAGTSSRKKRRREATSPMPGKWFCVRVNSSPTI